jgi:hypothetical protein
MAPANRNVGSIITSLPDASEIGIEDLKEYEKWVRRATTECFLSASEGCPVIFVQTDRRKKFSNRVCDPFCGYGTVLHVAEELGMVSVGVDIDPKATEPSAALMRKAGR